MTAAELDPSHRRRDNDADGGNEFARPQPHDTEAEAAILGLCLAATGPDTILDAARLVAHDDFYDPRHQQIWHAIIGLAGRDDPTDPIAVRAELAATGTRIDPVYLIDLLQKAPPGRPAYYARHVVEHAERRRHLALATRIDQAAREGAYDPALIQKLIDEWASAGNRLGGEQHHGRLVTGAAFVLDHPDTIDALWGHGDDVLWARGETLLIAGPSGVGKTTLGQRLTLARIGIAHPEALGYPVQPAARGLYLAMDRPAQARRSLARMVSEADRPLLEQQLAVWKGPPPRQVVDNPRVLLELARQARADFVVVDSVKDTAVGIAKDEVGSAVNASLQELLADEVDVLALHHIRKTDHAGAGKEPQTIDEIYGSTWITSGAGSVISLWGAPGDPIVSFKHMKQPAGEVGPYKLRHGQDAGDIEIWHGIDIMQSLLHSGRHGMTASALATMLFPHESGKNSQSEIEKARRRLDRMVGDGLAVRTDPNGSGRGSAARYHAAFAPDGEVQT